MENNTPSTTTDYRSTVFLPNTRFAMRGDLPKREPALIARWHAQDLYALRQQRSNGRPKFIVHDGPPYANGHLHAGHALNKILKDVVGRSRFMMGYDAAYVPGWDCHGLPIEWKIEERYRAKGLQKEAVPVQEFRAECRAFATEWIAVQCEEFQRLGILGEWQNPYTTMNYASEAAIIRTLGDLVHKGYVVRKAKPVLWSVVEKTALAEAEVEYHDRTSNAIFVDFLINRDLSSAAWLAELSTDEPLFASIWTTTPWTLPANRAIAFGDDIAYVVARVTSPSNETRLRLLARDTIAGLQSATHSTITPLMDIPGAALQGIVCQHPWHGRGYDFTVPLLSGSHVTAESGTGLVHIAPSHGLEDFAVGIQHGLEVPHTLGDDGIYTASIPLFAGEHIFKVEPKILEALKDADALWHASTLTHSYPHSWRSKAPLIYRATPQWFLSLDHDGLRDRALAAIAATTWIPASGENRLRSMIDNRPDWCLSRQRAWGVPIALFLDRASGEPLRDPKIFERIAEAVERDGCDVWFDPEQRQRLLMPDYNPDDYDAVTDILDVWFDAGCTQDFVLRQRPTLQWPADLYLEGSDQHRGWFQSSLLLACAQHGQAPFRAVLTHGFVVDEHGRKMSKSLGNSVDLPKLLSTYGADIVRLWTVSVDYTQDLKIGGEILKQLEDMYRRFRNTFRYLLGALHNTPVSAPADDITLPTLEQWVCHRLAELDRVVQQANQQFDYQNLIQALHHFCATDLSAFYFDIRKDTLYCDAPSSPLRQAVLSVFDRIFDCLTRWLAPILCFTAEEAWLARHDCEISDAAPQGEPLSVHLTSFPVLPSGWFRPELGLFMDTARQIRRLITTAVERERTSGTLGSSLQAHVTLFAPLAEVSPAFREVITSLLWEEFCIVSQVSHQNAVPPANAVMLPEIPNLGVLVQKAEGTKCPRCWKVLPSREPHGLCERCDDVVHHAQG